MAEELVFEPTTKHKKIDLFPAILYKGVAGAENNELLLKECRLIVTNDYIYAIIMEGTGPIFAVREELVEFAYVKGLGFQIDGAHNRYFGYAAGECGCGSRLRGMPLLRGVGQINPYK